MADSAVDITAGTGTSIDTRTEATNGNHRQVVVLGDPSTNAGVAPVDATEGIKVNPSYMLTDDAAFTPGSSKVAMMGAQLDDSSTDSVDEGDAGALRMTPDRRLYTAVRGATISTDITRPADTTAYAANDALSDSTSAPTSGGFTFTSAASKSGGSGIITDLIVTSSADPATTLQGEIFLFNTSVTNINDNAAFAVSDAEIKTCVGKIAFTLEDVGNNQFAHVQRVYLTYTCSGSANLRFLVRVKNAYTPASAEVLTFSIKCVYLD
jgi:hypothetical protein